MSCVTAVGALGGVDWDGRGSCCCRCAGSMRDVLEGEREIKNGVERRGEWVALVGLEGLGDVEGVLCGVIERRVMMTTNKLRPCFT